MRACRERPRNERPPSDPASAGGHRAAAKRETRAAGTTACALIAACLAVMPGCKRDVLQPDDPVAGADAAAVLPNVSYTLLASIYNDNLRHLDRLWARADVEARWVEPDGDDRFEKGNGVIVFVPPRRVALTLNKLGKTYLWAGSNDRRYWLIDNLGDGQAYVGLHVSPPDIAALDPAPPPGGLPFKPDDVPHLLGLKPLPLETHPTDSDPLHAAAGEVAVVDGLYRLTPARVRLRVYLEPDRLRPVRVELFDDRGEITAVSRLTDHAAVEVPGLPEERWPVLARDAWLYPVRDDGSLDANESMRLELGTTTTSPDRIRDRAFDLDTLLQVYEPEQVIDLDPPTRRVAPLPDSLP